MTAFLNGPASIISLYGSVIFTISVLRKNEVLRKKLKDRVRNDEEKGVTYAEIAYGKDSYESEIFRNLYFAWNSIDDDEAELYNQVQTGIAKLIESDSVP